MATHDCGDVLRILANRAPLLAALQRGVQDKRVLEEDAGLSRSALNRALNDLEEYGLVEETADGYEVTAGGEAAIHVYDEHWEPFADVLPHLEHLEDAAIDPDLLAGARVVEMTRAHPDRPLGRFEAAIDGAAQVRVALAVGQRRYVEALSARVGDGCEGELLLADRCFERLQSTGPASLTAIDGCGIDVRTVSERPPFSLAVVDDSHLWLGIHDDQGTIKCALANEAAAAVARARRRYDELLAEATAGRSSEQAGASPTQTD